MSAVAAVELEHVSVSFGPVVALEDVTLRVERGEFLGVVGPNGAGKTTLLEVILGVVKPDTGVVRVFGETRDDFGSPHKIGYVPQVSTLDARFPIRVLDVVLMGRYPKIALGRLPGERDRAMALEALSMVRMQDLASRPIGRLSSGQRQRVLIARALAGKPELLLLDEPMTGIDTSVREGLYDLVNELHRGMGLTVILVSHDLNVISKYVDKMACMNRKLVAHGLPRETVGAQMLAATYGDSAMFFAHGEVPHLVVEPGCIMIREEEQHPASTATDQGEAS